MKFVPPGFVLLGICQRPVGRLSESEEMFDALGGADSGVGELAYAMDCRLQVFRERRRADEIGKAVQAISSNVEPILTSGLRDGDCPPTPRNYSTNY